MLHVVLSIQYVNTVAYTFYSVETLKKLQQGMSGILVNRPYSGNYCYVNCHIQFNANMNRFTNHLHRNNIENLLHSICVH